MKNFRAQDMSSRGKGRAKVKAKPEPTQLPADPANTPQPQGDGRSTPLDDEQQGVTPLDSPPQVQEQGAEEVPAGTTAEILQWVNGDRGRAQRALDTEQSHSSPRHGLTGELNKILSE